MNRKSTNTGRHKICANEKLAVRLWGRLTPSARARLSELVRKCGFEVGAGDLQMLDGKWYVTHSGLLRLAQRHRCAGIAAVVQRDISNPDNSRWVFRATVYTRRSSRGFVGYGDADPSNVSPLVRGAEMRVAETRAVNRALRKAYGIGLCSVEELGWLSGSPKPSPAPTQANGSHSPNGSHASNGSGNGQPRLRDRLCLLIRQYNLDPTLVKAYAADFCGTAELREASRDLVESFISQLAAAAHKDRDALLCKLNSYALPTEVKS
jgi:hypothetical protein